MIITSDAFTDFLADGIPIRTTFTRTGFVTPRGNVESRRANGLLCRGAYRRALSVRVHRFFSCYAIVVSSPHSTRFDATVTFNFWLFRKCDKPSKFLVHFVYACRDKRFIPIHVRFCLRVHFSVGFSTPSAGC